MHSVSNLILHLRALARSSIRQNEVQEEPTTSRRYSIATVRPSDRDFDNYQRENNGPINNDPVVSFCPRCDYNLSRKTTMTSSMDENDAWYSPQRKQERLPSTTASSRRASDAARDYISKRSMELLGLLTYLRGDDNKSNNTPSSSTPSNVDNNSTSWFKMLSNLRGTPRIGLFIDVTPEETASSMPGCLEKLYRLASQLSHLGKTSSSRQTDREIQVNPMYECTDSSVQCDCPLLRSTTETYLNARIRKKFKCTSQVTTSKSQEQKVKLRSSWLPTPVVDTNKKKVFNSGDDLFEVSSRLELDSEKTCTIEEDHEISIESKNTSRTTSSGRLYTVPEMPSTIVLRPRCKDVSSLPTQPAIGKSSEGRIRGHRSYIQTDYVTKTVLSVLHDSRSPANVLSVINAVSIHSESSKRSLGKFLLNERLKRILSEIITTGNRSSSISSAKQCAHSTMSVKAKKTNYQPTSWDQQVAIYGKESPSSTSIPEIYLQKSIPSTYDDEEEEEDEETTTEDFTEDDVDLVHEVFVRSCSFSRSAATAMESSNQNSSSDKNDNISGESSDDRNFLPKDSCSFAESSRVVQDIRRRQASRATPSSNQQQTDFIVGFVHVEHGFLDKGIQVDIEFSTPESTFLKEGEEMTGLVYWKPSLASNIFFKHLSFVNCARKKSKY